MSDERIYRIFIQHLDVILTTFEYLENEYPEDFDASLSDMIMSAHTIIKRAYGHVAHEMDEIRRLK